MISLSLRRVAALVFFTLLFATGCVNAVLHSGDPVPGGVPITGPFRFAMVSDPPYARPPDNSPQWELSELGPKGLLYKVARTEGVAWVVIEFNVENPAAFESPSLFLTFPPDGEDYYINGIYAHSEGKIDSYYERVPSGPRYVPLPAGSLKAGKNELAMRVLFSGQNINDFGGPIYIGDDIDMNLAWDRLHTEAVGAEALFLTFYATTLLLFAFIFAKNTAQTEYLAYIVFILLIIIYSLLSSHLVIDNNLSSDWFIIIKRALFPLLSGSMLGLISTFSRRGMTKVGYGFIAGCVLFAVAELVIPPLTALTLLSVPYKIFMFVLALYFLSLSAYSVYEGEEESVPILLGVLSYSIGSRIDLFLGTELRNYAISSFAVCMFYALASRHARLTQRLGLLSQRLLDAHEEERHRLARDMHDGVGQSLLGLKLKLQMLGERVRKGTNADAEVFTGLASDTNEIIEEVRRTARDLRPAFIESMDLAEALGWYAETTLKDTPIEFYFHPGESGPGDPPIRIKDNIYRIFQEILANAMKHSRATRIDVTLFRKGKTLTLLATDNGQGFVRDAEHLKGIGLSTMQERAELLGGVCTIESTPGRGTTVSVEVPIP